MYTTSSLDCSMARRYGNLEAYQPLEVGLDEKKTAHVMCVIQLCIIYSENLDETLL